ncbi:MAG: energy transducer TonB [Amphritea sp.]|nr:energy transducer TonB [Amphritea sp.]
MIRYSGWGMTILLAVIIHLLIMLLFWPDVENEGAGGIAGNGAFSTDMQVTVSAQSSASAGAKKQSDSKPEPEPEPELKPESKSEPKPEPEPEPEPEAKPEAKPEPKPEPKPGREPDPITDTTVSETGVIDADSREAALAEASDSDGQIQNDSQGADSQSSVNAWQSSTGNGSSYALQLRRWIEKYKRYPPMAQQRRMQGVGELEITIDRHGRLQAARLIRKTGYRILDKELRLLPDRASPFPPIPSEFGGSTLTFTVPVRFGQK